MEGDAPVHCMGCWIPVSLVACLQELLDGPLNLSATPCTCYARKCLWIFYFFPSSLLLKRQANSELNPSEELVHRIVLAKSDSSK